MIAIKYIPNVESESNRKKARKRVDVLKDEQIEKECNIGCQN